MEYGDDINRLVLMTPNFLFVNHEFGAKETEKIRLCTAAGLSASLTASLMNPLECLRVRWNMIPKSHSMASEGIIQFASHILRTEGLVRGLWRPGVFANGTGMGIAGSLRFGFYEDVRDSLAGDQKDEKKNIHMIASGIICGAFAYPLTTPFQLLKTRIQAQSNSGKLQCMVQTGASIVREQGFFSLWRGFIPSSVRGASFSAGQMFGYDGCKSYCRSTFEMDDTPQLHILASLTAAMGAAILSSPADFVMSRVMSSESSSVRESMWQIYTEHGKGISGILGFWRGVGIVYVRLMPGMLTFSILYEQFRNQLGLGYMT